MQVKKFSSQHFIKKQLIQEKYVKIKEINIKKRYIANHNQIFSTVGNNNCQTNDSDKLFITTNYIRFKNSQLLSHEEIKYPSKWKYICVRTFSTCRRVKFNFIQ